MDSAYTMAIRLTLIVPIYNGRAYIKGLIRQIVEQRFSGLEVILVDDGSSDDSAQSARQEIAQLQSEISWNIIEQENQGQGGARNTGLAAAHGMWIAFLDQDDRMRSAYLQTLYNNAQEMDCDILISGYDRVDPNGRVLQHVPLQDVTWSRFMNITPWGKMFRTSFLREHGIRFYETPYGEDIYYTMMLEACKPRIRITDYVGYCWVNNAVSVSNTVHRSLDPNASALSLIRHIRENIRGIDYEDPEVRYFLWKTAVYHVLYIARQTPGSELRQYNEEILAYLEEICPGIGHNELIHPARPVGERTVVRLAVWCYTVLRHMRLDGIFLTVLSN